MKKLRWLSLLLIIVMLGTVLSACGSSAASGGKNGYKMSLITMDSMDQHWLKVNNGAQDMAKSLGNVTITFDAPSTKVDASVQAQLVENAIANKVNAILLAALNKDALVPVVEKAKAAGIVVILIDSGVNTDKYDAFFATNNGAAAATAADTMANLVGKKGKIAIVNAQAGAGTTMTREQNFKDQMAAQYPDIEVVDVQYSDGDKTKAMNIATDFMTKYPDLVGIYACNEGATVGVGNAVKQAGKSGTIKVVGFDFSDDVKSLITDGAIQATMVQNPYVMGTKGVEAAYNILAKKGGPNPKDVDTGVTVATKDNLTTIK